MKNIFAILLLAFLSLNLYAQDKFLKDEEETKQLSMLVTDLFKQQKISEAFKKMKPYWPLPQNELDAIEDKSITYLNLINERFGKTIGTMKVKEERISDIAIRETYLIRYENNAIRMIFTYYKNDKGWIVNAFKWDDSYEEEFKVK